MLPRVSVPNTESRTTCFVLHHIHIFAVIFQISKPNPATYILHKIFAISLVSVSVRRRRPVEVLFLFTSLRDSTCSISTVCYCVSRAPDGLFVVNLSHFFLWDSFDVFDIKTLLHFSVSSTLSALSHQGGFVLWEMLSSGTHRFSQFPWCLLLFCFLFCFFLSRRPWGYDSRGVSWFWWLPAWCFNRGPTKKGGPKVGIDLFVPIFSVLHRWCLCHCWCPLKSKGFKEHTWYYWRRRWLTASIISLSQCNPVLVVPFTMLL